MASSLRSRISSSGGTSVFLKSNSSYSLVMMSWNTHQESGCVCVYVYECVIQHALYLPVSLGLELTLDP